MDGVLGNSLFPFKMRRQDEKRFTEIEREIYFAPSTPLQPVRKSIINSQATTPFPFMMQPFSKAGPDDGSDESDPYEGYDPDHASYVQARQGVMDADERAEDDVHILEHRLGTGNNGDAIKSLSGLRASHGKNWKNSEIGQQEHNAENDWRNAAVESATAHHSSNDSDPWPMRQQIELASQHPILRHASPSPQEGENE